MTDAPKTTTLRVAAIGFAALAVLGILTSMCMLTALITDQCGLHDGWCNSIFLYGILASAWGVVGCAIFAVWSFIAELEKQRAI